MKEIIHDFNNYVKQYDLKTKEMIRKYHHTFRVMDNIEKYHILENKFHLLELYREKRGK